MSHNMGISMAIGPSGRIVIEIDPELKRELYGCLSTDGLSLREWFLETARQYLDTRAQLRLDLPLAPSGERRRV
jgi:hypothetical protein